LPSGLVRAKHDAARFTLKDDDVGIAWQLRFCPLTTLLRQVYCKVGSQSIIPEMKGEERGGGVVFLVDG